MSKLLFLPMSYGRGMGPIVEMISLAKVARIKGHEICFAAKKLFETEILRNKFFNIHEIPSKELRPVDSMFFEDFAVFQGLGDKEYINEIISSEQKAVDKFKPDVIVSLLQLTAIISARKNKIKFVSIARWTEHPDFSSPVYKDLFGDRLPPPSKATPVFNEFLELYDLPTVKDVWDLSFMFSDMKIAPSSPEIEPGLERVFNLHYVGFIKGLDNKEFNIDDWILEWSKSEYPKVFVYLSAKQFAPDFYIPIIIKAFDNANFKVIISTGQHSSFQISSTENILVTNWVPGDFVISHSDIIISTGTRTICLQSLLAGACSVLFPGLDSELLFISSMMQDVGCGIILADSEFEAARIIEAVNLINKPEARLRSRQMRERLLELGGPERAIELVEELLRQ